MGILLRQPCEVDGEKLNDVREIGKTATGKQKSEALTLEHEVTKALFGLKPLLLDVGATGRLLITGELQRVLPLENAKAMHDANPIKNGKWQPAKALTEKRLAEMALEIRTHDESVRVIVLGASHDLRPHLLEDTDYLRLTVRSLLE